MMQTKINANILVLLATISYPFVIHFLVLAELFLQASVYILAVALVIALQNFLQGHKWLANILLMVICIVGVSVYLNQQSFNSQFIIFIPPVLIPLTLAYLFGKTLLRGQTPFITLMAQKIKNSTLGEREIQYTRNVTIVWFVFFIINAIEDVVLALYTDIATWSYITNFLNYFIIAALFIIEYVVRRIVLSEIEHPSFIGFIRKLIRAQHKN